MYHKHKAMRESEIFVKSKMSKQTAPSVIFQSSQFFQSASGWVLVDCREVNEA